ncbi:MAG TPA: hypothetical protein VG457_04540 [Planctomycetota bacterium]|jgi:hypothetical protein|nr:hypothetical protein [Planctomycetota bacterium]
MRKRLLFLACCAALNTAAQCNKLPPDSVLRAEITPEELSAGPSYHQMKGAILNDVRIWRELDKKIETEGYKEFPRAIDNSTGVPICTYDQTEYEIYALRSDLADQPYRLEETAYYCKKESVYFYHYQGGSKRLNLWLGPYRIDRKRPKTDDP